MDWIKQQFSKETWSPYVAGILLGIVVILAVLLSKTLLGASGAFENLAGMIGKAIAPTVFGTMYFDYIMPAKITWGVYLMIGIFFGGLLGAASSKTLKWGKKDAANSDLQWKRIFGPQTWKRWVLGFLGAIVLEYGAGLAGGCTSGLLIAGGSLLVPAAFIFMAGMFASGIVTALIVYRKRY
jgi:uncharacterized membrane protein YedE/YeeE